MAILPIVELPNNVLRRIATPVTEFTPAIKTIAHNMVDTICHCGGIGLSAPQVNESLCIVVSNLDNEEPTVFINPKVVAKTRPGLVQESCLSVPGLSGNVLRATTIEIEAQDIDGHRIEQRLEGMHAVCMQHEIDHLQGVLFIDRVSRFKRLIMRMSASQRRWLSEIQPVNITRRMS